MSLGGIGAVCRVSMVAVVVVSEDCYCVLVASDWCWLSGDCLGADCGLCGVDCCRCCLGVGLLDYYLGYIDIHDNLFFIKRVTWSFGQLPNGLFWQSLGFLWNYLGRSIYGWYTRASLSCCCY